MRESGRDGGLGPDGSKNPWNARQARLSLTLHGDPKAGAVTFVFGRHLAPVCAGVSRDHFVDGHLVSVDLFG